MYSPTTAVEPTPPATAAGGRKRSGAASPSPDADPKRKRRRAAPEEEDIPPAEAATTAEQQLPVLGSAVKARPKPARRCVSQNSSVDALSYPPSPLKNGID
jgi:hypothetical protein